MKTKLISIALALVLSISFMIVQGQDNPRTSVGVLGGINFQNLNGKDFSGDKLENDMILGFHAGINLQIPIVPEFYFQPGLLFSTKGAKNTNGIIENTYKLSYIELPLNLLYRSLVGNGYILVGFGPYISYGIMGKVNYVSGSVTVDSDIEFQNVVEVGDPLLTTYFKPLDAGGNVFVGYEMAGGLFFQLNTQFGMLNIHPEDKRFPDGKNEIRNTGFGLSLGYRF
jgi:hypothetical protein